MKTTRTLIAIVTGLVFLASCTQKEARKDSGTGDDEGVVLHSYQEPYRMSPPPTLHSTSLRIRVQSVELLNTPGGQTLTKIVYIPWYGKISSESLAFRKEHETQTVSLLVAGDHTGKVNEKDILRVCFYPN